MHTELSDPSGDGAGLSTHIHTPIGRVSIAFRERKRPDTLGLPCARVWEKAPGIEMHGLVTGSQPRVPMS